MDGADGTELARMSAELNRLAQYADEQEKKANQLQHARSSLGS